MLNKVKKEKNSKYKSDFTSSNIQTLRKKSKRNKNESLYCL